MKTNTKMKSFAVKLLVALLGIASVSAINPHLTPLNVKGCSILEVGSNVGVDFTDPIDINDLTNNTPELGGLLRSRVCFKGTSDLLVRITDTKANPKNSIFATLGQSNKKSFLELNGIQCGTPQEHGPIFSSSFYTCGYVSFILHPSGTKGTSFINIEGIEPSQVSCTAVQNPGGLRYISFGTNIDDVTSALIFYDCPMTLIHDCFDNKKDDLKLDINLKQNQTVKATS